MRTLAWTMAAGLLAAPVLAVAQGAPPQESTAPISDQGNALSRAVSPAQALLSSAAAGAEAAITTRNAPGSAQGAAAAAQGPVPHQTLTGADAAPGKLVAGRTDRAAAPPGGGMIVDADGRALEVVPPGVPAAVPPSDRRVRATRSTEPAVAARPGPAAVPLQPPDAAADEARQARKRRSQRAAALFGAIAVLAIFVGSRLRTWG